MKKVFISKQDWNNEPTYNLHSILFHEIRFFRYEYTERIGCEAAGNWVYETTIILWVGDKSRFIRFGYCGF